MKRTLTFSLAVALVLVASVLFAATTEYFSRLSCLVPTDWRYSESSGGSVSLYSNYNSSERMWVDVGKIGSGELLEDIARDYYSQVRGRDFQRISDYYSFTYDGDGYTWYVRVADNRTISGLTSNTYCIFAYTSATDPRDAVDVFDSITVRGDWMNSGRGGSSGGCNTGLFSLLGLLAGLALLRKK